MPSGLRYPQRSIPAANYSLRWQHVDREITNNVVRHDTHDILRKLLEARKLLAKLQKEKLHSREKINQSKEEMSVYRNSSVIFYLVLISSESAMFIVGIV